MNYNIERLQDSYLYLKKRSRCAVKTGSSFTILTKHLNFKYTIRTIFNYY
jgi:hypothetical protein